MKRITKITHPILVFLFLFCAVISVNAQFTTFDNYGACINCTDFIETPSAVLEVQATDKGILIPRLASPTTIVNPANGLMIYNYTLNAFQYYDGTEWKVMGKIEHISFPETGNTFIGEATGISTTTGDFNTATGSFSMLSNTVGDYNTAVGHLSLNANLSGSYNIANGYGAMYNNTMGSHNVSLGFLSLFNNTDRSNLVAVGDSALFNNGLGATISWQSLNNTAIGSRAMCSNTIGYSNTATGSKALYSNIDGNSNTVQTPMEVPILLLESMFYFTTLMDQPILQVD